MSATLDHPLAGRWAALRAAEPALRVRDAARRLAVSEAELVACLPGRLRLRPDWPSLLQALTMAGEVMALTRNAHCVHERHGTYRDVSVNGHMGLVLGEEIDLRLFLARWATVFFVPAGQPGSPRGSIQVFDAAGDAVHKVFATAATPAGRLEALAAGLALATPPPLAVVPAARRAVDRPDAEIDLATLRDGWRALRDTHEFFPLLRRAGAGRQQAFRLVGEGFAQPLGLDAIPRALGAAAELAVPIMVFVGNPGCIQIHSGPVSRLVRTGPWFNVLDPAFNLHLNTDGIAASWIVRKPTADGVVTSVEAFDAAGEVIAMLFGRRKPGTPELADWQALAEGLVA